MVSRADGEISWSFRAGAGPSGLAILDYEFFPGVGGAEPRFLTVSTGDPPAVFRRKLDESLPSVRSWLGIHTHLLPEGPNEILISLEDVDGKPFRTDRGRFSVSHRKALARAVSAELRRKRTPLFIDGECDSLFYDFGNHAMSPWFMRPTAEEFLQTLRHGGKINAEELHCLRQFHQQGYCILPARVESDLIHRSVEELEDAVRKKWRGYERGSGSRLEHLHMTYPGIRELWSHPTTLNFLSLIFQGRPLPCQTLAFVYGSEQDEHQDTIHLTSFPAGYMCGVWIALEDIRPGSGELEIFPGSQNFERIYMETAGCRKVGNGKGDWTEFAAKVIPRWTGVLRESGIQPVACHLKKGEVLIWQANLMHRGSPRRDRSLTRKSVVIHYFAEGAVCFYDSTGEPAFFSDQSSETDPRDIRLRGNDEVLVDNQER